MDRDTIVIILLSIQVTFMGFFISRLCYKLGYEQGRSYVYTELAEGADVGTCLAPGGCGTDVQPTIAKKGRHHK